MTTASAFDRAALRCSACGTPIDTQHFDSLGFLDGPGPGRQIALARFELPRQYCGVLEGFQQFAAEEDGGALAIETPALEWQLRVNGRPLDPYLAFRAVLNRWGETPPRLAIPLDEGSVLEMIVRHVGGPRDRIGRVGARLLGRYWFNDPYERARVR